MGWGSGSDKNQDTLATLFLQQQMKFSIPSTSWSYIIIVVLIASTMKGAKGNENEMYESMVGKVDDNEAR